MKRLFLHIGSHKTGTTALQYFFWKNRKVLQSQGVLYPEVGTGEGYSHGVLANVIKPNNRDTRLANYQERLLDEIKDSDANSILLSSEVFMEGYNVAEAVRRFIGNDGFVVSIVVYLRNQVDWLQSVYNEVIRDPYRRFTGDIFLLREYLHGSHDYEKMLEPWARYFGEGAIVVRPYGKFRFKEEIYQDFLRTIGVNAPESFDYNVEEMNQNIRFHPLATEFLRRLNRFAMMQDEYFLVIEELAHISPILSDKYGDSYITITADAKNKILTEYKEKNRALLEKYAGIRDVTLFEDIDLIDNPPSSQSSLDAEVQHFIIDNMSEDARRFLEKLVYPIGNRKAGMPFLKVPPVNNENRLNEIILRQRFELRKLYESSNKR